VAVALLISAAGLVGRVEAAPITVSVDPVSQEVLNGASVLVDILVSGGDPIGGVSFLLNFDSSILTGVGFTLDASLDPGVIEFGPGFSGGTYDSQVVGLLPSANFRLGTLEFLAIAPGVSPLTFHQTTLSSVDGLSSFAPKGVVNGQVCVGQPCPVPEPGLLAMFGSGAVALIAAARRRRSASRV
jgi:hypothetical protein